MKRVSCLTMFTTVLILNVSPSLIAEPDWTEGQKLLASDGAAGDVFGGSVALSGDTALVSAYFDDDNGADSGSAYVYTRTGGSWTEPQKLLASDGAEGDLFGYALSLEGDTVIIGAHKDDTSSGSNAGSVYVFTRTGATWTRQAEFTPQDSAAGDYFGISLSLVGDTALVGACGDDSKTGSVYVFTRTGSTWAQQAKLLALDRAPGDQFGVSVSLDQDTALIGAYRDDTDAGGDSGSAYLFTRSGTDWTQQAKLTAQDGAPGANFGYSVSLDGDTALIGAFKDDAGSADSGSAYVFIRNGTAWTEQQKLFAADGAAADQFGVSVSLDGNTGLVGAYSDDDNGTDSGSAYLFTRTDAGWTQSAWLAAQDVAAGDLFGISVALSGDTAFIGAPFDDDNGAWSGAAYEFTRSFFTVDIWSSMTQVPRFSNFVFNVSVTNNGSKNEIAALWTAARKLPGGSMAEPVKGPVTISLAPGQTRTWITIPQWIGAIAPGTYRYFLRLAGTYPGTASAEDFVDFEVISSSAPDRAAGLPGPGGTVPR